MLECGGVRQCGDGDTYVLALRNSTKSNLNLGLGQNIGGGGHVNQEVCKGIA